MEKEEINEIVNRYQSNEATEKDSMLLESWYLNLNEDLPLEISLSTRLKYLEEVKSALDQQLNLAYFNDQQIAASERSDKNRWPYVLAVAAVIICALFILLYPAKRIEEATGPVLVKNNSLLPAGNKASLILSNGKKINLSAVRIGDIAAETGTQITKIKDGELVYNGRYDNSAVTAYHKIETPNGGVYKIHLPDGTNVWLNAASTLRYPTSFTSLKERKVELSGEAYFEVARNKHIPFRVVTDNQVVEVVGTHFNINAYKDENAIKTTLLEGRVKINNNTILKAGQLAINSNSVIKVEEADPESAVDWKNGKFSFNDGQDFQSAMHEIERWYNVKFIYEAIPDVELRGRISRQTNLSDVLEKIEQNGKVSFRIEGRSVIVTK